MLLLCSSAWSALCLAQASPTLEETTDWIVGQMKETQYTYKVYSNGTNGGNTLDGTEEPLTVRFEACRMTFVTSSSVSLTDGSASTKVTKAGAIDLKLLGAASLHGGAFTKDDYQVISGPKEVWNISLRSAATGTPAFSSVRETLVYSEGTRVSDRVEDELNVPFRSRELGERVQKAFQHAITLCGGGKQEPF
jgi:hypothetical protein